MTLCDSSDVKDFLGISSTDSSEDTFITSLCSRVSDTIATALDRTLEASSSYITEVRDGDGTEVFYTREWPINSISEIRVRDSIQSDFSTGDVVSSSNYEYDPLKGRIILTAGDAFRDIKRSTRIVYSAGYSSSGFSLPGEIKQSAVYLTSFLYLDSRREGGEARLGLGAKTLMEGGTIQSIVRELPSYLYGPLMAYRKRHV
ncbi:hypothetical protein ACFLT7_06055 [candidate division KSB1 bacterium]